MESAVKKIKAYERKSAKAEKAKATKRKATQDIPDGHSDRDPKNQELSAYKLERRETVARNRTELNLLGKGHNAM